MTTTPRWKHPAHLVLDPELQYIDPDPIDEQEASGTRLGSFFLPYLPLVELVFQEQMQDERWRLTTAE